MTAVERIDRIEEAYADRYRWFQREFCDLDDGYASARLADRMLVVGGDLAPGQAQAPAVGTVDTRQAGRPMTPVQGRAGSWFTAPRRTVQPEPAVAPVVGAVPAQPGPEYAGPPQLMPGGRTFEGAVV